MHILGKVLLWLCVIVLIPLAIVFSTMLLGIRNHQLTEIEKERKQLETTMQQLADARVKVAALDEDLQRLTRVWGDVWVGAGQPAQNPGSMFLRVAANSGLPALPTDASAARPVVYLYADKDDGSAAYLGAFSLQGAAGDQLQVGLTRAAYPGEVEAWPSGNFHIRRSLPANWVATPADLHGQILMAYNNIAAQSLHLESVNSQIQASQAVLSQRMAELNGDTNAVPGASQEVKDGLVATLAKFDTERNRLLSVTDGMRRDLVTNYVKLRDVLESSEQKVKQLPGANQGSLPAPQVPPQARLPVLGEVLGMN